MDTISKTKPAEPRTEASGGIAVRKESTVTQDTTDSPFNDALQEIRRAIESKRANSRRTRQTNDLHRLLSLKNIFEALKDLDLKIGDQIHIVSEMESAAGEQIKTYPGSFQGPESSSNGWVLNIKTNKGLKKVSIDPQKFGRRIYNAQVERLNTSEPTLSIKYEGGEDHKEVSIEIKKK